MWSLGSLWERGRRGRVGGGEGKSQRGTQEGESIFLGSKINCSWWLQPWNQKALTPWKKSYDQPRQHNKKQTHYFANKGSSSRSYGFSSSHVWMWELNHEESWAQRNSFFWTVMLKKTLESPLDCKEIKPVHSEGNQSWLFIGRTDAEAETPILRPPDAKNWLIGKDSDSGRDLGQEEKGMTEGEMAGWHHRLNGHKFEWMPGVRDGQGGLACCNLGVTKSWTQLSDWTELNWKVTRATKPQ